MEDKKCVQVALRIRPLVASEVSRGCNNILDVFPDVQQVQIAPMDKSFTFNYVFGPESTDEEVYGKSVEAMIGNIFEGYNLTILAYGQTGSGKTYTMGTSYAPGESPSLGVIPRAVAAIFDRIRDNFTFEHTVTVSFTELYQETLYDLLADRPREQCALDIREDATKSIVIPNLTEVAVSETQQVLNALARGASNRATGATNMNAHSSRSHAIFTLTLAMQSKNETDANRTAKFHLVDLAGSERQKKTGAVGTAFREGVNINRGLLVLGNVISALGEDKIGHVPYRDSNLTRLLKDSLGGNSVTLMIACVSPADYNLEETLSTLRYADRARKIRNKPIVNQDPKSAEINALKKTIQQMKLQLFTQNGELLCPAEIELIKKENADLREKIRELTAHLSSTLFDKTGLLEQILLLQSANEKLHAKIVELKQEYDTTMNDISVGLDKNDVETIKKNLEKLDRIRDKFVGIDSEQKRTEDEIRNHQNMLGGRDFQQSMEPEMSKDQESYTNLQIALSAEIEEVTKKLAMKEHLANEIRTNVQHMIDYTAMATNESKIAQLEREKDELLQQLKSLGGSSSKVSETRRKRVQELETQISELRKKIQGQARLIKLKEKDELKIRTLNSEIVQMKQTKVKLIRRMREEAEKYKTWRMERERELAKLREQDRKKQNAIVRMEAIHSKQQNVLKRKFEETIALTKRLKDALAVRKATQETKMMNNTQKLGPRIKHEVDMHLNLVEANITLNGMIEDRAMLYERLDQLKTGHEQDLSMIKEVENDVELRSVQIMDLQQKIMDFNEEHKTKNRLENVQTMSDAKYAINLLFDQTGELKKQEVLLKSKLMDVQANRDELADKVRTLEAVTRALEAKHNEEMTTNRREYEEKLGVFLRQLNGVQVDTKDEELKRRCTIQEERIEELHRTIQQLTDQIKCEPQDKVRECNVMERQHVSIKTEETDTTFATAQENPPDDSARFKTPEMKPRPKPDLFPMHDLSFEDLDDVSKDPDWKKTPVGKWVLERKKKLPLASLSTNDSTAYKRTSEGGCTCTKSDCGKRCGCRRGQKRCASGCKCRSSCTNRNEGSGDAKENDELNEKKPRLTFTLDD